ATVLRDEWAKIKDDVDHTSPFYRAIECGMAFPLTQDALLEGGIPLARYSTRDILFNTPYGKRMTASDRFNTAIVDAGFLFLATSYKLVRLLKESPQTTTIQRALNRLEHAYEDALHDIQRHVDFAAFEPIDHSTLARVQLGSGLIALTSLLANG